jgi:hypothetical protein
MATLNRKTLEEYFKTGNLPTEESFKDLIESMVNIRDDGINRTHENGFCIVSTGVNDRLMSFFKEDDVQNPVWTVELNNSENYLCIKNENNNDSDNKDSFIVIAPSGNIGIKKKLPSCELDVNGTIRSSGRIGCYQSKNVKPISILADGEWHVLIDNLNGCNAFEIVAGVGKKRTGKYALMHAIAINIFGNGGKIRYTQSYYLEKNDSIRLKWVGNKKGYKLFIRTMSDFGVSEENRITIKCSITKLWFDEFMDGE